MKKNKSFLLAGLALLSLVFAISCTNAASGDNTTTSSKPQPKLEKLETLAKVQEALKTNIVNGSWTLKATKADGKTIVNGTAKVTRATGFTFTTDVQSAESENITLAAKGTGNDAAIMTITGGTTDWGFANGNYKVTELAGKVTFTQVVEETPAPEADAEGTVQKKAAAADKTEEAAKTVPVVLEFSKFVAPEVTISYSITEKSTATRAEKKVTAGYKLTAADLEAVTATANNGFSFKEWQVSTVKANVGDEIVSDTTLTAVWNDDVPAKVTGVTATAGDKKIDVSWTASEETDITDYIITVTAAGETVPDVTVSGKSSNSGSVTELKNGTEYTITVKAKDAKSTSEASASVTATPKATTPEVPETPKTTYTVNFNKNGGTGEIAASITPNVGSSFDIPDATLTKSGFNFLGWSENQKATAATYTKNQQGVTLTETTAGSTKTLFAIFEDVAPTEPTLTEGAHTDTTVIVNWEGYSEADDISYIASIKSKNLSSESEVYDQAVTGAGDQKLKKGTKTVTFRGLEAETTYEVTIKVKDAKNEVSQAIKVTTKKAAKQEENNSTPS